MGLKIWSIVLYIVFLFGCATVPETLTRSQVVEKENIKYAGLESALKSSLRASNVLHGRSFYVSDKIKTLMNGNKSVVEEEEFTEREIHQLAIRLIEFCETTSGSAFNIDKKIIVKQGDKSGEIEKSLKIFPNCSNYRNSVDFTDFLSIETSYSIKYESSDSIDHFLLEKDPIPSSVRKNKRLITAINKRNIYIGMPEKGLILSWGKPEEINSSRYSNGSEHKQYVYGVGWYVYTDGEKVTSWQTSE